MLAIHGAVRLYLISLDRPSPLQVEGKVKDADWNSTQSANLDYYWQTVRWNPHTIDDAMSEMRHGADDLYRSWTGNATQCFLSQSNDAMYVLGADEDITVSQVTHQIISLPFQRKVRAD